MTFADADISDRVITHIFGCGLTLAGIMGRADIGDDVARRLQDVIEELDTALNTIRHAALAALVADRDQHPDAPAHDVIVAADPEPVTPVLVGSDGARRRLSRFADDAFAYALHGHDFYRMSDHELWAHESDGLLLSARSGTPLARRDGHVFYDIETNVPLYYEDTHLGPLSGTRNPAANQDPHPRN